MLHRLRPRSVYDVFALLALIVAVGGTSAYAANTIGSTDIIDGQVKSVDIGDGEVNSADVKDQSLTTFDVSTFLGADIVDGTLTSADIQDFSLGNGDFLTGSVDSRVATDNSLTGADIQNNSVDTDDIFEENLVFNNTLVSSDIATGGVAGVDVADNTLTGSDINESTLAMPPTTTATFAGQGNVPVDTTGVFTKVTSKTLPAGSYAIAATANVQIQMGGEGTTYRDTACQLRNTSGAFIGGGRDRRLLNTQEITTISVSMNGGVTVPGGGGEVGLYCQVQAGGSFSRTADGQMMIIRLDGFF
jgi:hypothetical protein